MFYSYLPSDFISWYINLYIFLLISIHYRKETICTTEFDVSSKLQRVLLHMSNSDVSKQLLWQHCSMLSKNIVQHYYT